MKPCALGHIPGEPRAIFCIVAILFFCSLLAGCALVKLGKETDIMENSTILVGNVTSKQRFTDTPIVVAAYTKEQNKRTVVHYTTLHEPGPYELIVPKGNYYVVAFADKNKNLTYEPGEPIGQYSGAEPLSVHTGGVVTALDILISDIKSGQIDLPAGMKLHPKTMPGFHSSSPGTVEDLNSVLFSYDFADKGFWSPSEFFREAGGNIYFLEAYDPKKIPILFIHGAAGSPRDWQAFVKGINRKRYQPWFYYYPSGTSLDSMSYLLLWKLFNLQNQFKFRELCITAHSMGGLIARSFIVNYSGSLPCNFTFISISSPWGGEELADSGVKYAPAVIPAWRDMQPDSEFIKSIFSKKMPVTYYLFFGHKGNRNLLRPNNDKVVTLMSMLDQRAQREAKMIYGFNEDHLSILASDQVLSQYSAILAATYEKKGDTTHTDGYGLRVDFSFDHPEHLPKPPAVLLLLRSVEKKHSETWLYLNPEDSGRTQGPFPAGKYEASLISFGFAPAPIRTPVTIGQGSVPTVSFTLKPDGCLFGYILKPKKSGKYAGVYQEPDTEVPVESITLQGAGVVRKLVPRNGEKSYYDCYLSGTDGMLNGFFFFYGLPEGKYDLTIHAKGYQPYSGTHKVQPGRYDHPMVVELMKIKP